MKNLKLKILVLSTFSLISCVEIPDSSEARSVDQKMKQIDKTSQSLAIKYRDSVVIPKVEKFVPYRIKTDYEDPFTFKEFAYQVPEEEKQEEDCTSPNSKCADAPDISRARELLESYELNELAYVGTMQKNSSGAKIALVKTPDIGVVKIKIGQYLGKNFGKVVQIKPRSLLISEKVKQGLIWKDQRKKLLIVK